jgi:hypothetical protein
LDFGHFRFQFDPLLHLLEKHLLPPHLRQDISHALVHTCFMLLLMHASTHGSASVHLPSPMPYSILQRPLQLFPAQALRALDLAPQDLLPEVDRSGLLCRADAFLVRSCSTRDCSCPLHSLRERSMHANHQKAGCWTPALRL